MITLNMTTSDYYDSENEEYVMTIGASVQCLHTEVRIREHDGTTWDCYLASLEFIPAEERGKRDVYIARYRVY